MTALFSRENRPLTAAVLALCVIAFAPPFFCQFVLGWGDLLVGDVAMLSALGCVFAFFAMLFVIGRER